MPRTSNNKAAGNFMLGLQLLAPGSVIDAVLDEESKVLAKASRSAILTYQSIPMEMVHRGVALPWHLIGWRDEAEVLKVPMIEGVEFSNGWRNIPDQARLELRSDEKLQIYSAKIEITAQLRGLRCAFMIDILLLF
jgi:seipin